MQAKLIRLFLILAMVTLLPSCAAPIPVIRYETKIVDTSCSWVKPITISVKDEITDKTAREVLAHNRLVARNCP